MRFTLDTDTNSLTVEGGRVMPLDSPEAFRLISQQWVAVGWALKYSYSFTWLGRPIVQLPEDLVRIQEVIVQVRPDVIVETGVAHGGSLVFYASLCQALGTGRVIGIDIEIRPHNRAAIESHPMARWITLFEGSSTDPTIVEQVRNQIRSTDRVLVILDSNHTKAHVRDELKAYAPLVSPGSYIVATDGIMSEVAYKPGGRPEWVWDNPTEAAREFAASRPDFELVEPPRAFDESHVSDRISYWPGAYLRRVA